jgi:hypothetical protein
MRKKNEKKIKVNLSLYQAVRPFEAPTFSRQSAH